jgi:hypothetical protein
MVAFSHSNPGRYAEGNGTTYVPGGGPLEEGDVRAEIVFEDNDAVPLTTLTRYAFTR